MRRRWVARGSCRLFRHGGWSLQGDLNVSKYGWKSRRNLRFRGFFVEQVKLVRTANPSGFYRLSTHLGSIGLPYHPANPYCVSCQRLRRRYERPILVTQRVVADRPVCGSVAPLKERLMAKNKKKEVIHLVCEETGDANYTLRRKTGGEKLHLKKYSPRLRRHTLHNEKKKK